MFKTKTITVFILPMLLFLFSACEDTPPPQAGYSFRIEATSLSIEPSLSQKATQSTPIWEWGNTVYENSEGYYGTDSTEAGEYIFTITAKYMRAYWDSVAVDTTVTKIINMGEGKSYIILGSSSYGDYSWSVSEY